MLKKLIKRFVAVFLPFRCHTCHTATDFGVVLCDCCLIKLQGLIGSPQRVEDVVCSFPVYTLSSYDSLMSDIIRVVKYRPSLKLLKILAQQCQSRGSLKTLVGSDDILIPVPMHSDRQLKRGFNQAEFLAEKFAVAAGCRFSPALERIRATRPQADCDEKDRQNNLEGAFALGRGLIKEMFSGRHLILVDDVVTTGSTLQKCCETLQPLGPAKVSALAVSHSFRRTTS
ncbi:MAG TPA: phosphoribosyltransferase family protein [Candidatus Ozemobacteraceae bacterium]|nr:phosphoribosyltransferase family protein [Candidatus Ozemobacteraceae bacterium]